MTNYTIHGSYDEIVVFKPSQAERMPTLVCGLRDTGFIVIADPHPDHPGIEKQSATFALDGWIDKRDPNHKWSLLELFEYGFRVTVKRLFGLDALPLNYSVAQTILANHWLNQDRLPPAEIERWRRGNNHVEIDYDTHRRERYAASKGVAQ